MDSLPPELFHAIFREIDDKDTLYTLLFVSRMIHSICEPLFYKSIRLTSDFSGNGLNACLDRLLADGNRLLGCVEEFTLDASNHQFLDTEVQIRILRSIFNASSGLKGVKYSILSASRTITFDDRGFQPFQLTYFVWTYGGHRGVDFSSLTGFLVAQPTLEHLELRFDSRVSVIVNLLDDALPHLSYLQAPLLLPAAIIPGRKVRHLDLLKLLVDIDITEGTAQALQHVISLFVEDVLMSRPTILYLQQCKNLKYIRLPGDGPYPTSRILNVLAIGGIEVRYAQITGSLERLDVARAQ